MMNGDFFSTASSSPRTIASPAAMPSEPPMKSKSCTRDDAGALQLAVADLDGVVQPGLGARVLDAVDILALIAKLERIGRHFRQRDVVPGLIVEDRLQPRHRRLMRMW